MQKPKLMPKQNARLTQMQKPKLMPMQNVRLTQMQKPKLMPMQNVRLTQMQKPKQMPKQNVKLLQMQKPKLMPKQNVRLTQMQTPKLMPKRRHVPILKPKPQLPNKLQKKLLRKRLKYDALHPLLNAILKIKSDERGIPRLVLRVNVQLPA